MLHSLTPLQGCIKEILSISLKKISPRHKKLKTSLKKSNLNKKVMSDTNECCVCYEATEHLTPYNHLVCESCYPRLNTCPMCRAPLEKGIPPMGFSLDEINWGMANATLNGHIEIVRLLLQQGANNYNEVLSKAAREGHQNIVELMLEEGADDYNEAMTYADLNGHISIVDLIQERMNSPSSQFTNHLT